MTATPFWRTKSLHEFSDEEWESLCDGCAKCCVVRMRNEDTGAVVDTNLACELLDQGACRCSDYDNRIAKVASCVIVTPHGIQNMSWMPNTCAYRLVNEGKDLYWWHHLKSGSFETVHEAGMSVRGRTISELEVREEDFEDYAVIWPGEEPEDLADWPDAQAHSPIIGDC